MHELAATENILATAVRAGQEHGARSIQGIRIEVGRYSGLLPEFVRKYFAIVSRGTIAEGAVLSFVEQPVRIRCASCGGENCLGGDDPPVCPSCGSEDFRILSGFDIRIIQIEVPE